MSAADAVAVVERFLAAVGAGKLAEAAELLAPDAKLTFPGGHRFTSLAELADASATRYRFVDKHRDSYDVLSTEDGKLVVYSIGRLFGENRHGVRFDNVRYVDRFLLRNGLIAEQQVWNDLAETGVLTARDSSAVPERLRASS